MEVNAIRIAATAQEHGLSVFTYDDHFKSVPGLTLVPIV